MFYKNACEKPSQHEPNNYVFFTLFKVNPSLLQLHMLLALCTWSETLQQLSLFFQMPVKNAQLVVVVYLHTVIKN